MRRQIGEKSRIRLGGRDAERRGGVICGPEGHAKASDCDGRLGMTAGLSFETQRLGQGLATYLSNADAQWLLAEDMLAGLNGLASLLCMLIRRRCDPDDIDLGLSEQLGERDCKHDVFLWKAVLYPLPGCRAWVVLSGHRR